MAIDYNIRLDPRNCVTYQALSDKRKERLDELVQKYLRKAPPSEGVRTIELEQRDGLVFLKIAGRDVPLSNRERADFARQREKILKELPPGFIMGFVSSAPVLMDLRSISSNSIAVARLAGTTAKIASNALQCLGGFLSIVGSLAGVAKGTQSFFKAQDTESKILHALVVIALLGYFVGGLGLILNDVGSLCHMGSLAIATAQQINVGFAILGSTFSLMSIYHIAQRAIFHHSIKGKNGDQIYNDLQVLTAEKVERLIGHKAAQIFEMMRDNDPTEEDFNRLAAEAKRGSVRQVANAVYMAAASFLCLTAVAFSIVNPSSLMSPALFVAGCSTWLLTDSPLIANWAEKMAVKISHFPKYRAPVQNREEAEPPRPRRRKTTTRQGPVEPLIA